MTTGNYSDFSLHPRPDVVAAKWVQAIASGIVLGIYIFLGVCHSVTLQAMKPGQVFLSTNRWRIYLAMSTCTSVILQVLIGLMSWNRWDTTGESQACTNIPTWIAFFFVLTRQTSGLTLWSRAKVVHDGLRMKSKKLRLIRIALFISITVVVWIIFGW